MDLVITPEPHLIPGYTGHCPHFRFREGNTYGKLTHKLFTDPCTKHAPELIISAPKQHHPLESPTQTEVQSLKDRSYLRDSIYRYPIIPGYDGFIPNMSNKTGKRFMAAATAGIAEHEALAENMRCERQFLKHLDLLQSSNGRFNSKLRERMMPMSIYRAPLIPVQPRAQAVKIDNCNIEKDKRSYSKFTVPHFMKNDDKEKYIIKGYGGHIPMTMTRYGQSSKQLTNSALVEFTNNYHHRKSAEWCPMELTGVASSCPNSGQYVIYHRTIGMVPSYSGHVPGAMFSFGRTYGNATVDAKYWLAFHKD